MKKKGQTWRLAALLLVVGAIYGLIYAVQLIGIGAAYKAKMLCSEVFVAGRQFDEVLADLEIDDLVVLRILRTSINEEVPETTASLFGLLKRTAQFRGESGCALLYSRETTKSFDNLAPIRFHDSSANDGLFDEADRAQDGEAKLAAVLDEAFSEPDSDHLRRTRAVVVVHQGRLIAERYAPGFGPETPFPGWSMTKGVLNALVGILVRQGRLSLKDPIDMPQWRQPGDPRVFITLNQLLHMNSGLKFNEDMSNPLGDVTRMLLAEPDMAAFAADKALEWQPGTHWQYSSGNSNIVSGAIRKMMEPDEYRRFPRLAMFEPLGMKSAVLETDASGTYVASSFMYATARDWVRFGLLYLNDGVWKGNRILPENWIEFTRAPLGELGKSYGAHFWLKLPDEYNPTQTSLPNDAFHAVGHEGQFVTIIPSHQTVIVRLGKTRYAQSWDHGAFIRSVLSAIEAHGKS